MSGPISSTSSTSALLARAPRVGLFPKLIFVHGLEQKEMVLNQLPFTIGRKTGKMLEIPDPRVSRDHAEIISEEGAYYVVDTGSKLGTFVNKEKVTKRKLVKNDRIEFGVGVGAQLVFDPSNEQSSVAREFLSQISVVSLQDKANDLEKLALFLDAARKLNTAGALDEVLVSLIGTTLKLTGAERGFIFLRNSDRELILSAACTSQGERLTSAATISNSILNEAAESASEFMVTDTALAGELASRQSIVAHDLRTVVAIPLRRAHETKLQQGDDKVLGVLYLDSKLASGSITGVSHDILGVIAREAAALVESTHLAQLEEEGRRYQQELNIAAGIQQRLMTVTIPEIEYATLSAKNIPCADIGGDFYDVITNEDGLTLVVTDVSGKGISAALLASILQGMIYSQIIARVPLAEITASANRFLCQRVLGEKYATVVIARITPEGDVELVNCGHVPPLVVQGGEVVRMRSGNLPVGLLAEATYEHVSLKLAPGDRLVLVTDGVTEAEGADGEFFGEERLEEAARSAQGACFDHLFAAVRTHCGAMPLTDDCTVVEVAYRPAKKTPTDSGVS